MTVILEGEEIHLVALFPDTYPYTRLEIRAPDLNLHRHQNPFSKNLCLIGRATRNWDSDATLARFIQERLPLFLETVRSDDPDEIEKLEQHQGEPFSEYYSYKEDSLVLVDSSWSIDPVVTRGDLILGLDAGAEKVLRGAVLQVSDDRGRIIAAADSALKSRYTKTIEGRWTRTPGPIRQEDLEQFFEQLYTHDESLRKFRGRLIGSNAKMDVVGIMFPEEHRWRSDGNGWVFAVRVQGYKSNLVKLYLARTGRAGRSDFGERVPELAPLKEKKIAVFGLGGIGAPSAIEFARGGLGELRILDGDFIDPPTIVRWPLGLPVSGRSKSASLKEFISVNYPYTKVKEWHHRLGVSRESSNEISDLEVLGDLLDEVDLVYDATAEYGLHDLLSDFAALRGVPYIAVTTTAGAWGGRVVRIMHHGQTEGCWKCFQRWMYEGKIEIPREDPAGDVQPAGCADPTFTGTSFDVTSIALAGVRLAVSTLTGGVPGAYPNVDWDVAIVDYRDENGQLILPDWRTFKVVRHPNCQNETAHGKSLGITTGGP